MAVANFKIPFAWDLNRPKFDGETTSSLRNFLRNTEAVCTSGGITDEQKQKEKLLEYLDHAELREQWERLPSFAADKTYSNWKKEILQLYPEIEDMTLGSVSKLKEICQQNCPIGREEIGKLRRFTMAFTNEAEKLL
ncbi:hypothetical protein DFH08DRAFT_722913, partial [Mycena albidolilacea]